jgi:hypothetical protein
MFLSPMDGVGFGVGGSGSAFPNLTDLHWRHVAEAANMSLTGSLVDAWNDTGDEDGLAGTGEANLTGSGDTRPNFGAATGPNGTGSVLFDDDIMSIDSMSTGLSQPYHFFWICKQVSWTQYERLASYKIDGSANGNIGHQVTSSPILEARFGVNYGDRARIMELGTWVLYEVYGSNTTGDYVRVNNGDKSTGVALGSTGPFIRFVMCGDDNMYSLPSHWDVAEAVHCGGGSEVTGDDHAQLMQYFRSRYGLTIS